MNQSEEEQLFNDLQNVLNTAFKQGAYNLQTAPLVISVFERSAAFLQELVELKDQHQNPEPEVLEDNEIQVPGTKQKVLKTK